jgi:uncharacterized YigZ family protein
MNCIKSTQSIEEIIKKSRFIGIITPCADEREVLKNLKQMHDQHPNATHIAFAYRLKTAQGISYRFHDAGEPTGTAGKPIYQHLDGNNLINVLVAVIRYYGGVKLGAGGLTRAYGNTAKLALDAVQVYPYVEMATLHLTLDYAQMQPLEYQLKKLGGEIVQQAFTEQIRLTVQLPVAREDELLAGFSRTNVAWVERSEAQR